MRLPPEDLGPQALLAAGAALDLVETALDAVDPEGEIWPSTRRQAWQAAYEALDRALWLADEARGASEREAVTRAVKAGYKCCAECLAWKPEAELEAVQYWPADEKKRAPARRWYRCCEHKEGEHGREKVEGASGGETLRPLSEV